jgi:hypothetical protein
MMTEDLTGLNAAPEKGQENQVIRIIGKVNSAWQHFSCRIYCCSEQAKALPLNCLIFETFSLHPVIIGPCCPVP